MTALGSYFCEDCDHRFDYLHHPNKEDDPVTKCPECESPNFALNIGNARAPVTIVQGNSDFVERQRDRLTKRSNEHFQKKGRDEAIDRQRQHWKDQGIVS